MDKLIKSGVVVLAIVIFVSFFLPWVSVEAPAIGGLTKILTGKAQSNITSVSGYDVPVLANGPDSRFMISVIQIFNPGIRDADQKSYLIWGVPILAVVLAALMWLFGQNKWVSLAIGIIAELVFLIGAIKVLTTDLDKLVLRVSVTSFFWLILVSYLIIGCLCQLNFINLIRKK